MWKLDKESLLSLNDAMRETINGIDDRNPEEIMAFASSMIVMGNEINKALFKGLLKKK